MNWEKQNEMAKDFFIKTFLTKDIIDRCMSWSDIRDAIVSKFGNSEFRFCNELWNVECHSDYLLIRKMNGFELEKGAYGWDGIATILEEYCFSQGKHFEQLKLF